MISLNDDYSGQQTPFVCLKGRLSQAWVDKSICVLILYIIKLVLLRQFLNLSLNTIRDSTLTTCSSLESAMNTMINARREAAIMANEVVQNSMASATRAIFTLCDLLLLAINQLILFAIEITVGTWTCLTVSLFNIAATESLDLAESVVKSINDTVVSAANDIANFVEKIEELVNDATGLINEITKFVTGQDELIKGVNASLDSLRSISIPSDVTNSIESLKSNVPTYEDAQRTISDVISIPFDAIRKEVSAVRNDSSFSINSNNFKVPPIRSVSVCNQSDVNAGFNDVIASISKCVDVFITLCAVFIFFSLLWRLYTTYHRWCRLNRIAQNLDTVVGRTAQLQAAANMSAISFATMTGIESLLSKICMRFQNSRPEYMWFIQYLFNENALAILNLGLAGLLISLIEFGVFAVFKKASQDVKEFVMNPIVNASNTAAIDWINWRASVNLEIANVETNINKQVLGWVHSGSLAVNSTLSSFMIEINKEINKTLGDTPFYSTVNAVVTCVIGNKVSNVEKGLTWIHSHSQVQFPPLGLGNTSAIMQVNNSTEVFFKAKLDALEKTFHNQIITQFVVSGAFIAAWVVIALIGMIYVIYQSKPDTLPPWSATSEKTFDDAVSPIAARATKFFEGPQRRVQSRAKIVDLAHRSMHA